MDAVNKVFKSEHYPDWERETEQAREKVTEEEKEMYGG